MKSKKLIRRVITVITIIAMIIVQSSIAVQARAGSHSSRSSSHHSSSSSSGRSTRSSGGSIFSRNRNRAFININNGHRNSGGFVSVFFRVIMIIMIIIAIIILICIIRSHLKKKEKFFPAKKINQLDNKSIEIVLSQGGIFNKDQVNNRVEEVYFSVQNSWCNRNMTFSKEHMSLRLYNEYTFRVNEMIREDEINILEDIRLLDVQLEAVCTDIMNPFIIVKIKGSMFDYWQTYSTGIIKKGNRNKKTNFVEHWKFIVENNRFVLDEII